MADACREFLPSFFDEKETRDACPLGFPGFLNSWTATIRIVDYLLPQYDVRLAFCSFSVQVPGVNYADCSRLANDESLADSGREIQIDLAIGRRVFRV